MSLVFWLLVAAMLALAMVFLLPMLLRGSGEVLDTTEQQNLELARERLKELEQEKAAGALTDDAFDQAKQELEQMLAADLSAQSGAQVATKGGKGLIGALIVVIPILSILIYQYLGDPRALQTATDTASQSMPEGHASTGQNGQLASVDSMVAGLAARLEKNPDDPQGWYMLARSYMSMQSYLPAANAYERLYQLVGNDPSVMVAYADALAMTQNGRMNGKPIALIEQALEIQPEHATGLWLAGMAYREQGRHVDAIESWEKARTLLVEDAGSQVELNNLIKNARKAAGLNESDVASSTAILPGVTNAQITVKVTLDPSLASEASPEDTVFILARAISGPPMPLAVVRKQVKDLPVTVTLDDSQAMMPAMRLSKFQEVAVVARISASGNPKAQSGDLEGMASPVIPLEHPSLELVLNSRVP